MIYEYSKNQVLQDLHIHTIYSTGDSAVVPEQTIELIGSVKHAHSIGISDHLDYLTDDSIFEEYERDVRSHEFKVGIEVNGSEWTRRATELPVDYYVYHCRHIESEYRGAEELLLTGRPVIIAHPMIMGTEISNVPQECFIEINNRYVWRNDWRHYYESIKERYSFVISSDAHQPNWLNQNIARYVAEELGIKEHIVFA